jgi:hypothetical protein
MHTLEDIVELLVGKLPKPVNIRLDRSDARLLISISQQISTNVGLTDRQSDLILKKIDKYSAPLKKCGVDVEAVVASPSHRLPVRHIDRTQLIYLDHSQGKKKPKIMIKYTFSKNFAETWSLLEDTLTHITSPERNIKELEYSEQNILAIVKALKPLNFDISDEIEELYKKSVEISENPEKYLPYLDIEDDKVKIMNAHPLCEKFLDEKFPKIDDSNILAFTNESKKCGIFLKSPAYIRKIGNLTKSKTTKKILVEHATRFRYDETEKSLTELFDSINETRQWPILVVLEENSDTYTKLSEIFDVIKDMIPREKISVFFRMKDGQKNSLEFNQFVRDNHLNNYIDSETQCVFISKTRIPKPLLRSEWKPATAVCFINHDYGKLGVYLNDFSTVFYVNNSVSSRHDRLKRAIKIVQL